jgi:hypothetical protein
VYRGRKHILPVYPTGIQVEGLYTRFIRGFSGLNGRLWVPGGGGVMGREGDPANCLFFLKRNARRTERQPCSGYRLSLLKSSLVESKDALKDAL